MASWLGPEAGFLGNMGAARAADLPERYHAWELLERNVRARPHATALVGDDGALTFAEVASRARRVAGGLRAAGVGPGEVVALLASDGPEWVASFFGALRIGAVALGMNTLLTPAELAFILRDSGARTLIAEHRLLDALRRRGDAGGAFGALPGLPALDRVLPIGGPDDAFAALSAAAPHEGPPFDVPRTAFCTLNYSSGTTGEPKGILHGHQDLALSAELYGARTLGLTAADRTLGAPKLFFTYGLGGNLLFPWHVGASAALFRGPPRDAAAFLRQIETHRPTVLLHAPTGYAAMLADPARLAAADLSSLRLCVSAGEALPAPLLERWRAATGLDILDGIGSTENFHIFVSNRPDDIRPGSSGRPVEGYEVRLVDDEGRDVPDGEIGNLLVRGETAALFYLNRPAESRRTFRGEWLATGDKYVRESSGHLRHMGRADDMLKVGGIWVSPMEVEAALLQHPMVRECAVVGRRDDAGLVKPHATVILAAAASGDEDALRRALVEHCRAVMADFKRPRWIEFADDLPKTATGKIQRFRLRRPEG